MSVLNAIESFFQTQGFMPHGMCLSWRPAILWTIVFGNALIALAYLIIPMALIYLVIKRKDMKFRWIFILFGAFILACGCTHVMSIITLWNPVYGLEAIILAFAGIVSILTAILIWPQLPLILKIPSPWELERLNEELKHSNEELDDFVYIVSHDLKEPLRGINNFSSFIAEDYKDKLNNEGKEQLDILRMLSQRMEALINDLLIYSHAGRSELEFQPQNINEIVEEKMRLLSAYLKENNATVTIENPLPTIKCDKSRIGVVFQNLIENAVKYNTNKTKTVKIAYRELRDSYEFSIADNGIGVPAYEYNNIFKIFKRLHERNDFGGGTGMGLTLIKKIVERHHGRIWLNSTVNEGTTFYFTIRKDLKPHEEDIKEK